MVHRSIFNGIVIDREFKTLFIKANVYAQQQAARKDKKVGSHISHTDTRHTHKKLTRVDSFPFCFTSYKRETCSILVVVCDFSYDRKLYFATRNKKKNTHTSPNKLSRLQGNFVTMTDKNHHGDVESPPLSSSSMLMSSISNSTTSGSPPPSSLMKVDTTADSDGEIQAILMAPTTIGGSGRSGSCSDGCTTSTNATKNKSNTVIATASNCTSHKPSRHKESYYRLQRHRFVVIACCMTLCVLGMNVVQLRQFRNLSSTTATNWVNNHKNGSSLLRGRQRKRHQPSFLLTAKGDATATSTTNTAKTTATTTSHDAQPQFLYVPPAFQMFNKAVPNTSMKYYHEHYQTKSFLLQHDDDEEGVDGTRDSDPDAPSSKDWEDKQKFLFVSPSVTTFDEQNEEEQEEASADTTSSSLTTTTAGTATAHTKESPKNNTTGTTFTHEADSGSSSSDDKNNRKTRQDGTRRNNIRKNKEVNRPPRRSPTKVKDDTTHQNTRSNNAKPPRSPTKEKVIEVEPTPPLLKALLSPLHLLEEDDGADEDEKKQIVSINTTNEENEGGAEAVEFVHDHDQQGGLFVPSLKHEYRVNRRRKKRKDTP